MTLSADPLTCSTREARLGWDFPSTAEAERVKDNKDFLQAVTPSPDKFPWSLAQLVRKHLRCPAWWPVAYGGRPPTICTPGEAEKTRKVSTHETQARLSRHEMKQKQNFISLSFFELVTHSKVCPNRYHSGEKSAHQSVSLTQTRGLQDLYLSFMILPTVTNDIKYQDKEKLCLLLGENQINSK